MNGQGYCRNRYCACQRCRWGSAMGPAVLVTLGVLFLLDTLDVRSFHYTWPVLLIVIGLVQVLRHNASTEGHIPRAGFEPGAPPPPPPGEAQPPASGPGTPGTQSGFSSADASDAGTRGIDHV